MYLWWDIKYFIAIFAFQHVILNFKHTNAQYVWRDAANFLDYDLKAKWTATTRTTPKSLGFGQLTGFYNQHVWRDVASFMDYGSTTKFTPRTGTIQTRESPTSRFSSLRPLEALKMAKGMIFPDNTAAQQKAMQSYGKDKLGIERMKQWMTEHANGTYVQPMELPYMKLKTENALASFLTTPRPGKGIRPSQLDQSRNWFWKSTPENVVTYMPLEIAGRERGNVLEDPSDWLYTSTKLPATRTLPINATPNRVKNRPLNNLAQPNAINNVPFKNPALSYMPVINYASVPQNKPPRYVIPEEAVKNQIALKAPVKNQVTVKNSARNQIAFKNAVKRPITLKNVAFEQKNVNRVENDITPENVEQNVVVGTTTENPVYSIPYPDNTAKIDAAVETITEIQGNPETLAGIAAVNENSTNPENVAQIEVGYENTFETRVTPENTAQEDMDYETVAANHVTPEFAPQTDPAFVENTAQPEVDKDAPTHVTHKTYELAQKLQAPDINAALKATEADIKDNKNDIISDEVDRIIRIHNNLEEHRMYDYKAPTWDEMPKLHGLETTTISEVETIDEFTTMAPPHHLVSHAYQQMVHHGMGYLSAFVTSFCEFVSVDNGGNVRELLIGLSNVITKYHREHVIDGLLPQSERGISMLASVLPEYTPEEVKAFADVVYQKFSNHSLFEDEVRRVVQAAESCYTISDGEDLIHSLEKIGEFPQNGMKSEEVMRIAVDALINPMLRLPEGDRDRQNLMRQIYLAVHDWRRHFVPYNFKVTNQNIERKKLNKHSERMLKKRNVNAKNRFDIVTNEDAGQKGAFDEEVNNESVDKKYVSDEEGEKISEVRRKNEMRQKILKDFYPVINKKALPYKHGAIKCNIREVNRYLYMLTTTEDYKYINNSSEAEMYHITENSKTFHEHEERLKKNILTNLRITQGDLVTKRDLSTKYFNSIRKQNHTYTHNTLKYFIMKDVMKNRYSSTIKGKLISQENKYKVIGNEDHKKEDKLKRNILSIRNYRTTVNSDKFNVNKRKRFHKTNDDKKEQAHKKLQVLKSNENYASESEATKSKDDSNSNQYYDYIYTRQMPETKIQDERRRPYKRIHKTAHLNNYNKAKELQNSLSTKHQQIAPTEYKSDAFEKYVLLNKYDRKETSEEQDKNGNDDEYKNRDLRLEPMFKQGIVKDYYDNRPPLRPLPSSGLLKDDDDYDNESKEHSIRHSISKYNKIERIYSKETIKDRNKSNTTHSNQRNDYQIKYSDISSHELPKFKNSPKKYKKSHYVSVAVSSKEDTDENKHIIRKFYENFLSTTTEKVSKDILEESSYSDAEKDIKFKLDDAIRHDNVKIFKNKRRNINLPEEIKNKDFTYEGEGNE